MSGCIGQAIGQVTYLGPIERRARASGAGDDEGVLGEGAQDSTRIVEELEGTVTGVGDGRCNLQVVQSVDFDVGSRGPEGQARDSGCRDRGGDEGYEGSTYGAREHRNLGGDGGRDDYNEAIGRAILVYIAPRSSWVKPPELVVSPAGQQLWENQVDTVGSQKVPPKANIAILKNSEGRDLV